MFFKSINWKKFIKWVLLVAIVLILINISNPHPMWWMVPTVTGLWSLLLLLKAHSDYMMRPKPKLTLRRLRMMKLKKINKKRLWKV